MIIEFVLTDLCLNGLYCLTDEIICDVKHANNLHQVKRRQLWAASCLSLRSAPEREGPAVTSAPWPKAPSVATDSAATTVRYRTDHSYTCRPLLGCRIGYNRGTNCTWHQAEGGAFFLVFKRPFPLGFIQILCFSGFKTANKEKLLIITVEML